jgi:CRP-like cAMP-binding protein
MSKPMKFNKGDCISRGSEGVMGFIQKGLLANALDQNCKLRYIDLFMEGNCFCSLSFSNVNMSEQSRLICLEECTLEIITREQFDKELDKHPELNNPARTIMEHFYINLKRRLVAGYCQSPTKQYLKLMEQSPELINRVPKKYLASYLNISPEALSRIRKKHKDLV